MNEDRGAVRILIVDDSKTIRAGITSILNKAEQGFQVVEAKNGIEALRKLEQDSFDLILTDVVMPEMGGVALVKEIRTKLKLDTPIIVMSGNQTIVKVFKSGHLFKVDDFISTEALRDRLVPLILEKLGYGSS